MPGSNLDIFDAQFAVNQFSGNQSLLVQILGKFIQQYENFDTLLTEHLKQEDFNAIKQQVHTIKGVGGNLGMKALYLECKNFEVSLAGREKKHTLDEFLLIFTQTLIAVKRYSAENSIQEIPEVDAQQDDKTALIAVLKRNEFISESKIQSYSQSLDLSSGELNALKQAIDNLDYAVAIQLLEG
ncbi:MAG: HPt (histidine-containing phosphotransfer) domain-containing protein [Flavobacteriales bacterium]|jgi:HPt (histidine-containing phosphotransfer) domain-containing protein